MAEFHPQNAVLKQFSGGELPVGISLAVSAHVDYCAHCQAQVKNHQHTSAQDWSEDQQDGGAAALSGEKGDDSFLDDVLDTILEESPPPEPVPEPADKLMSNVQLHDYEVRLPRVLAGLAEQGLHWKEIGKGIHQALLNIDRGTKCELISMEAGARVPRHTHLGREVMLVLDGNIRDDWGSYGPSDFVLRDEEDCHGQETDKGCVCLFVTDAPLKFTEGLPRLLNPLNRLWFWRWQRSK